MLKRIIFMICVATMLIIMSACNHADIIEISEPEFSEVKLSSSTSDIDKENFADGTTEKESKNESNSAKENVNEPSEVADKNKTTPNPQTPYHPGEIIEEDNYKYQEEEKKADALEAYLRKTLSTEDYGGIYLLKSDVVSIDIWVVNEKSVAAVLDAYTGAKFDVNLKTAKWSLKDMNYFTEIVNNSPLKEGEFMSAFISKEYNTVSVNIFDTYEEKLRLEVNKIMQENNIPSECVNIHIKSLNGENPVT